MLVKPSSLIAAGISRNSTLQAGEHPGTAPTNLVEQLRLLTSPFDTFLNGPDHDFAVSSSVIRTARTEQVSAIRREPHADNPARRIQFIQPCQRVGIPQDDSTLAAAR